MSEIKSYNDPNAVKKLKEIINETEVCMLCTFKDGSFFSACPMATQEVSDDGRISFFSLKNSDHNNDISRDNRVQLIYSNPSDNIYLNLQGHARIKEDIKKIKELWTPAARVWFEEGPDDPDLTLLEVTPLSGYYWDQKQNKMISFLKMVASYMTGNKKEIGIKGSMNFD